MNDPNGFIYYKGEYHLFYQYFPYDTRWGTMRWGHAVSRDLVVWEHRGVALFPTICEDQNGCFSGSALEYDGKMYLFYTGVHYHKPDPKDIHHCLDEQFDSAQLMLCSEDGKHFDNFKGKQVIIPPIEDKRVGDRTHTRDPKVWRGRNGWYLVLGSTTEDGRGKLLFYKSNDLASWSYVNSVSHEPHWGWMWECPEYLETEGGNVLLLSSMGIIKDGKREENQIICAAVDFEEKGCVMSLPDTFQYADHGLDLYATQSIKDEEGRQIMVAWLRMPEAVDGEWIGMLCMPRVIEVKEGFVYFRPHPNVESRYTRQITAPSEADEAGYRVSLDMEEGERLDIGGYQIFREGNRIHTDRSAVFGGHKEYRLAFETPELRSGCHLDIYVSSNIVEVFINQGEYVISNAVYGLTGKLQFDSMERLRLCTLES